ncbi:MAG: hypothetical protein ACRDKB_06690 [Actinomycetota bacterium]
MSPAPAMGSPVDYLGMLRSLPSDKTYENLQEVWIDLGGSVEDRRM